MLYDLREEIAATQSEITKLEQTLATLTQERVKYQREARCRKEQVLTDIKKEAEDVHDFKALKHEAAIAPMEEAARTVAAERTKLEHQVASVHNGL